jgi:CDP-diglyceride synthetase
MALKPALRRLAILAGMVLACGALVSLSQAKQDSVWAGASLVALAVGVSTLVGLANAVVQGRSPPNCAGAVSAVAGLSLGFLPFAAMIMGWMTDVFELRNVLLGSSICYAVIGLIVMLTVGSKVTGEKEAEGN